MQKYAITRPPGKSYASCISQHPELATLDLNRAIEQHREYVRTLKELGLDCIELHPEDNLPDACFVEDTVVIHKRVALITRPRFESRRKETDSIQEILSQYLKILETKAPATLEGGDVIHLEGELISGLTERTNEQGILAMQENLDVKVHSVSDPRIVHLKSYVTYLDDGNFVGIGRYANHPVFHKREYLIIPDQESYAANTLTINGVVLIPKGFPQTEKLLSELGYDTVSLDTTEIAKCEGALTCLSIIF